MCQDWKESTMLMSSELLEKDFFFHEQKQPTVKINNWKPHLECSPKAKKRKFSCTQQTLDPNRKRCTLQLLQKERIHYSHVPLNNRGTF